MNIKMAVPANSKGGAGKIISVTGIVEVSV